MSVDTLLSAASLVYAAGLFYAVALLVRDELRLRLLILAGTGLYIAYYFTYRDPPQWDAIAVSAVLATCNIYILGFILFERTTLAMSDRERRLFARFETLNPGQFRRLMKRGRWKEAKTPHRMTIQGEQPRHLYYLLDGGADIAKNEEAFAIGPGNFVAEIAFIRGDVASATVTAHAGSHYVEWDTSELNTLMRRSVPIRNAILALFNANLAGKLADHHRT